MVVTFIHRFIFVMHPNSNIPFGLDKSLLHELAKWRENGINEFIAKPLTEYATEYNINNNVVDKLYEVMR